MGKSALTLLLLCLVAGEIHAQSLFEGAVEFYKRANEIDTMYVEPKKYSFKVQANYTQTQEELRMKSDNGQELKYRSHISHKLGPALGVECLSGSFGFSLGATQVSDCEGQAVDAKKTEIGLNLYTPMLNIDLFYRETGDDFQMVRCNMPFASYINDPIMESFSNVQGLTSVKRIGGNAFYVFNHRKFSYPAAMTSACVQRRSAGSALAGIGYSNCEIKTEFNDYLFLTETVLAVFEEWIRAEDPERADELHEYRFNPSESRLFNKLQYKDFTLWGGYAYNWVPMRNMLVSLSATVGLGYKTQKADNSGSMMSEPGVLEDLGYQSKLLSEINTHMFDFNFVGRGSVQYNNGKWFAGTRFVYNYFNYHRGDETLRTDNMFWNWRLYAGFRFGNRDKVKGWFKKKLKR